VLTESPDGFPVLLLIVDTNRIKYVHGRPESAIGPYMGLIWVCRIVTACVIAV
jgi:hypothetical protein